MKNANCSIKEWVRLQVQRQNKNRSGRCYGIQEIKLGIELINRQHNGLDFLRALPASWIL